MSGPTKTAAEIRTELAAVQDEYTRLGAELADVEREQAALNQRRDACKHLRDRLDGGWRGYGEIKRLTAQLEQAERVEGDATRPRVMIGKEEHVVVKVTAARIFTRTPGRTFDSTWQLDGRPVGRSFEWSARIPADVAAKIVADAAKGGALLSSVERK